MLVAEVRRLARESGLDLETGTTLAAANELTAAFVESEDFEQLDEELQASWRWVSERLQRKSA